MPWWKPGQRTKLLLTGDFVHGSTAPAGPTSACSTPTRLARSPWPRCPSGVTALLKSGLAWSVNSKTESGYGTSARKRRRCGPTWLHSVLASALDWRMRASPTSRPSCSWSSSASSSTTAAWRSAMSFLCRPDHQATAENRPPTYPGQIHGQHQVAHGAATVEGTENTCLSRPEPANAAPACPGICPSYMGDKLRICTRNNRAFRVGFGTKGGVGPVSPCRADVLRQHLEPR